MRIRNPSLAALGLVLLGASAGLAALLVHDGEVGTPDLETTEAGDAVRAKGDLVPFQRAFPRAAQWAPVSPLLSNFTYVLQQGDPGLLVLVTSEAAAPGDDDVVVEGTVLLAGPHPEDPERRLVLIAAREFRDPILFR